MKSTSIPKVYFAIGFFVALFHFVVNWEYALNYHLHFGIPQSMTVYEMSTYDLLFGPNIGMTDRIYPHNQIIIALLFWVIGFAICGLNWLFEQRQITKLIVLFFLSFSIYTFATVAYVILSGLTHHKEYLSSAIFRFFEFLISGMIVWRLSHGLKAQVGREIPPDPSKQ